MEEKNNHRFMYTKVSKTLESEKKRETLERKKSEQKKSETLEVRESYLATKSEVKRLFRAKQSLYILFCKNQILTTNTFDDFEVSSSVKTLLQEEKAELVVDGKVDWKGRRALKHKHGGMKVSLLILGKLGLRQFEFMHGHLPKD